MAQLLIMPDLPIRVRARGAWLHGDEPLHPRVATLFAQHVVPSVDGQYEVRLGFARQTLEVEDTAFFVRASHETVVDGALVAVRLSLSDGVDELLDPTTLMQSADHVLYCRIRRHGLRVPCRFTPAQYHTLAMFAELVDERAYLRIGGALWALNPYDPRPLAS